MAESNRTESSRTAKPRPAWLVEDEPDAARPRPVRRIAGAVVASLAAAALVVFVLGAWNPWDLVVLLRYFGNPLAGAVWVFGLSLAGVWLLTPVLNEATQGRRLWARFLLGASLLLSLAVWGVAGSAFGGDYQVIAQSPDGSRRLVVRTAGEDHELRIWSGTGLAARDRGHLGLACGNVVGAFTGNDRVHVASVYGEFDLRLDPATGKPENTMGPTCSG